MTAYVVLGVFGVPARFPEYIAWQGGDGAQVLRSKGRVQRAAKVILEAAGAAVSGGRTSRKPAVP